MSRGSDESDRFDCGTCDRPNSVHDMVQCDGCTVWYHMDCAAVSPGISSRKWFCANCTLLRKSAKRDDDHPITGDGGQISSPKRDPKASDYKSGVPSTGGGASKKHSVSTSSSRALAQLALQRLEAKQKLEEQKLLNQLKELEKEKERMREEKELEEQENAIARKKLEMLEKFLEQKQSLEEQLADDDVSSRWGECGSNESVADDGSLQDGIEKWGSSSVQEDPEKQPKIKPTVLDGNYTAEGRREKRTAGTEEVSAVPPNANQIAARQLWPNKLPTFSGDPEEWPIFYSSYVDSNVACGFSPVENVVRLRDCLRGPARDAVVTKLMFPDAAPSIIETLRRLYGRPELLVNNLLSKVRCLEAPKPERLDTLMNFGMAVQQLCDHLEAAKLRSHMTIPTLLDELVDKLPAAIKLEWVRHKRTCVKPTLKEFGEFMDRLVEDASKVTTLLPPKKVTDQPEKGKQNQKAHVHAHGDNIGWQSNPLPKKPCSVCSKLDHRVRNCDKFRQMSTEERLEAVRQLKLCEENVECVITPIEHRLHREQVATVRQAGCQSQRAAIKSVLFRIVPITLYNGSNSFDTFAFLDEGSSLTLIESNVARNLGVDGVPEPLELTWTSNVVRKENASQRVNLMISGREAQERFNLSAVHTVGVLNLPKQSLRFEEVAKEYKHLENIPISLFRDAEPKLLIGLQHLDLFAPLDSRVGQAGEPIAVKCALGWTLYGPCVKNRDSYQLLGLHGCKSIVERELNELIRLQFVMDNNGIEPTLVPESAEVVRAKQILERTTERENGRFTAGLLWKNDRICFPDSLPMAKKRLRSLESKLEKDPDLRSNVHQQINDYMENNYAHIATEAELKLADPRRVWYLPMSEVTHPRKPNKTCLVWDAAAQISGVSLNSQLLKGLVLLYSLPGVISKFREKKIAFGGDIEKMFHQIRIKPEDKHAQRFLFRFDEKLQPDVYVMDVATFGATCSPCSAQYILNKNADDNAAEFPEAAAAIKGKTYMDDYFDSANTTEQAVERALQVKLIHSRAEFNMRNWVSNSNEVRQRLGETHEQRLLSIDCSPEEKRHRVLGIVWDSEKDIFIFSTSWQAELAPYIINDLRPTKRIILRIVMSLFDPMGFLAPYLIHGRMLIQDLWRVGLNWDDEVSDKEFEKWRRWINLLSGINCLEIPRFHFDNTHAGAYPSLQLHVFTDASELGYGCAAYFRIVMNGEVQCALVMAESKVAPLKYQSIPRMELQAAMLGFIHTDVEVVLFWIRSQHRNYKQFFAFRVGEILSLTEPDNWRYVPSKDNVADCLTKWCKDTDPSSNERWFRGPKFLHHPEESWPEQKKIIDTSEELRAHILLHHITVPGPLIDIGRISKWTVLLRVIAFVSRFASNCHRKKAGLPIETIKATKAQRKLILRSLPASAVLLRQHEYQQAERYLFRVAQTESFPDETRILLSNRDVSQSNKWVSIEKSSPLYRMSPSLSDSLMSSG
ncbi:uncharacterized protein LOC129729018 [Wyeomyia smithii]|uniref:uncharacterized protein LOC129729018 n=1 Tax=Wyeomyia smithii TaxID=174621 RepID=UPI002467C96D|nr:uncharacterized protein LOC129729018 [Wyeomyia smithii]